MDDEELGSRSTVAIVTSGDTVRDTSRLPSFGTTAQTCYLLLSKH